MPVVLATDFLIYLVVCMPLAYACYARRREQLRAPWRHVFQRPIAVIASIVLLFYVSIGVLDSCHFYPRIAGSDNYSTKITSILDVLLDSLQQQQERTYSAPLSAYSYAKEMLLLEDGRQQRDYPRLQYGGAHLDAPEQQWHVDILQRVLVGVCIGIACIAGVFLLLAIVMARRRQIPLQQQCVNLLIDTKRRPWYLVWLALFILLAGISTVILLAGSYHVFGTDKIGQDVLYQALKSVRTGIAIGTLTTMIMLPFAIFAGLLAGYFGGWIDDIIQYLYTTLNSIPGVLLIAAGILMLQIYIANHAADFTSLEQRADFRLLCLCFILGITSWTGLCRLLRAEVLKLREIDYINAAKVLGIGELQILWKHLLPNVMHIVIITIVLDFSGLVLAEAVLSYINIGVDPSTYSWGNMINNARLEMAREPIVWWSLAAALLFMFIFVLAANLFADAVRDAFDPRMQH